MRPATASPPRRSSRTSSSGSRFHEEPRAHRRSAGEPLGALRDRAAHPEADARVHHRRSPERVSRHRLRLRRPARLAAGRPAGVDRLAAVDDHELQPAGRARFRRSRAPPASWRSPTRRRRPGAASTASRSPPPSRGPSARSASRRCSFRTRSASSRSTPASRISPPSGRGSARTRSFTASTPISISAGCRTSRRAKA